MKRIVIVAILLCFCIGISVYTIYRVDQIAITVDGYVTRSLDAIEQADEDGLKQEIDQLCECWHQAEDHLMHFIRHAQIDEITKSVSRLQALASGEDYSELAAELSSIRWQIEHISESENLILHNVL